MSWLDERICGTKTDLEVTLREIHDKAGNMIADLNIADMNTPTAAQAYELATMARRLEKVCHQHWTYRDVEDRMPEREAPEPGHPPEDPDAASLLLKIEQQQKIIRMYEDEIRKHTKGHHNYKYTGTGCHPESCGDFETVPVDPEKLALCQRVIQQEETIKRLETEMGRGVRDA